MRADPDRLALEASVDGGNDRMKGPGGHSQPGGTRWSSLADCWPLPLSGVTVTKEEYDSGARP